MANNVSNKCRCSAAIHRLFVVHKRLHEQDFPHNSVFKMAIRLLGQRWHLSNNWHNWLYNNMKAKKSLKYETRSILIFEPDILIFKPTG
jgi:hypothetical protein